MIRALQLDDADLESGRLRLAGSDRPMGELTATVLREWLEYRRHRWPHTANPHLLVSRESALRHGPVSAAYIASLRGMTATLERLRIDCQLAEAMATGFDPLHLAAVFGISADTAIRYATNARQLTGPAPQAGTPDPRSSRLDAGEPRRALDLVLRNHQFAGTTPKQRDATRAGKAAPASDCHPAALPWRNQRCCSRMGV